MACKLIILDRDGVINHDSDAYIKSPEEWIPIPGSMEAIGKLTQWGWRVVVATNQSGVGRGLFSMNTLNQIHEKMLRAATQVGGRIEAVFFCPHTDADACNCRKPKDGLFRDIAARFGTELTQVPAIGDSVRDILAAQSAGARAMLVRTGKGSVAQTHPDLPAGTPVYADLSEAVAHLLK